MEGFSHWISLQAASSRWIRQTARQASPTSHEKLISKKPRKTQSKLMNAMQGFLRLSFCEKILSLLDILAHYRVNIRNKQDGRLLYKMLNCWANEFARFQLQFTVAMSTNIFEEGEHEGATEASEVLTFDCNDCKKYFKTGKSLTTTSKIMLGKFMK